MEEWRPILGPFYHEVSNFGRIRSITRTRNRGSSPTPVIVDGVAVVHLESWYSGTRELYRLDKIVFEAFHDDLRVPADVLLTHLDGDPLNCRLDNLRLDL